MALSRGRAGHTHCGRWRLLSDEEREQFGIWALRVTCTELPHGIDVEHASRWSGLAWWPDGELRRIDEDGS